MSHLKKAKKREPATILLTWLAVSLLLTYLGMMFGAVWDERRGFSTLFSNFAKYYTASPLNFIVGYTEYATKFIAVFVFAWTIFYIFQQTKFSYDFQGEEYGDAAWSTAKDFTKEFGNHDDSNLIEVNFGDKEAEIKRQFPRLQYPYKVNSKNYSSFSSFFKAFSL